MSTERHEPNALDGQLAAYLTELGQRGSSRRGALIRVGRFMLGLAGLSLVPVLPIDRRTTVSAQGGCGTWELCGQCGNLCNMACSCGSGGTGGCPSCLKRGTLSWNGCCHDPNDCMRGWRFEYFDCCSSAENASTCKGTACLQGCGPGGMESFPSWCKDANNVSLGTYQCTLTFQGGQC